MAESEIRILSLDDIWAAQDIEERVVSIPQWGGAVRIRNVSMRQVDTLRKQVTHVDRHTKQDVVDQQGFVALLICECLAAPKLTLEDYERLLDEKSAVALAAVQRAVLEVCGLSEAAVTEADKSVGNGSDAEVRVSSSAGTGDDPRGITATNVGKRIRALDSAV